MKWFALLFFVAASAAAQSPPLPAPTAADPEASGRAIVADVQKLVTPARVDDSFMATLGGAKQFVRVRGANRANPILLFVHGGPGATESPLAWTFQRPWEDFFTVVQWDQRGAGKSYLLESADALVPTLRPERYIEDAIELIELLRRRYGKRKVLVLGHSWGSYVGLAMAIKRPDLLYGYIGVGQGIDVREDERILFDWTLAKARADNNAPAISELEALQPYPGPGRLTIARTDAQRKWGVYYGALAAYRNNADFYFRAPRLSPDHSPNDRRAMDAGSALTVQNVWPYFAELSFKSVNRMRTPVLMILGRHDYTTPAGPVATWMERLNAPGKWTIWFQDSAHLAFVEEPGRFLTTLVEYALPLARDPQSSRPARK